MANKTPNEIGRANREMKFMIKSRMRVKFIYIDCRGNYNNRNANQHVSNELSICYVTKLITRAPTMEEQKTNYYHIN